MTGKTKTDEKPVKTSVKFMSAYSQMDVPVTSIRPGRHATSEDHIKALMASMVDVGLIEPIVIDKDRNLLAGYHRLRAAKNLGWSHIAAFLFDGSDVQAKIATIDENLVRKVLTVAERAALLAERKQLYEALHPKTVVGVAGGRPKTSPDSGEVSAPGFAKDTAAKTGRSRAVIAEEVAIGRKLAPEVMKKVKGSPIANSKRALKHLSALSADQQRQIIKPEIEGYETAKKIKREIAALKKAKGTRARRVSQSRCKHQRLRCEECGKLLREDGPGYNASRALFQDGYHRGVEAALHAIRENAGQKAFNDLAEAILLYVGEELEWRVAPTHRKAMLDDLREAILNDPLAQVAPESSPTPPA